MIDDRRSNDRAIGNLEGRVDSLEDWVKSMNEKLDTLIAAANMGKGAWWMLIKLGGTLLLIVGAFAWLYDHTIGKIHLG